MPLHLSLTLLVVLLPFAAAARGADPLLGFSGAGD